VNRESGVLKAYQPICVGLLLLGCLAPAHADVAIRRLQVEYRDTPLGIDVALPRFSWQMATTNGERGAMQTAYEIRVTDKLPAIANHTLKTAALRNDSISIALSRSILVRRTLQHSS
jgi:hypothetical protein